MICISIKPRSMRELLKKLQKRLPAPRLRQAGLRFAQLAEVRADIIRDLDFRRIPHSYGSRLIFACRSVRNGGEFKGSEKKRLALIQSAIDSGRFKYADVEYKNIDKIKKGYSKIIASYHNVKYTPSFSSLSRLYQRIVKTGADVIKIVTTAENIRDNLKVFRLLKYTKNKIPLIAFCMGEAGLISRVLYRKFGGWFTYASLDNDLTAPGQLDYKEMKGIYRADEINAQTRIYGLIGNPVRYSLSPYFFNYLFRKYSLNSVYLPFLVRRLSVFPELTQTLPVQGYSVTMPFKEKILKYLQYVTPEVDKIKAVNTIYRNKKGYLVGANTDGKGALLALESTSRGRACPAPTEKNNRVLILGAGGSARAIAYELLQAGYDVTISNRHYYKALKLARAFPSRNSVATFNCKAIHWDKINKLVGSIDILINTTPVGMSPTIKHIPIHHSLVKKGLCVMDTIYQPSFTQLLKIAKGKGCLVISGLDMFINQGILQFSFFTKQRRIQ